VVRIVNILDHSEIAVGNGTSPRWSPIDDRIAYFDGQDVVIFKANQPDLKDALGDSERHPLPISSILHSALEWTMGGRYLVVRRRLWLPAADSRIRIEIGLIDTIAGDMRRRSFPAGAKLRRYAGWILE